MVANRRFPLSNLQDPQGGRRYFVAGRDNDLDERGLWEWVTDSRSYEKTTATTGDIEDDIVNVKSYEETVYFRAEIPGGGAQVLVRTRTFGRSYEIMSNPSGFELYQFDIGADGTIWGIFRSTSSSDTAVYKSRDGGSTWTSVLSMTGNATDQSSIATHITDSASAAVVEVDDAGDVLTLHATADGGDTWNSSVLPISATGGTFEIDAQAWVFEYQLRYLPDGRIVIPYGERSNNETLVAWSDDDGATISGPTILLGGDGIDNALWVWGMWRDVDGWLFIALQTQAGLTQVYRSSDGATWTKVFEDAAGSSGDLTQTMIFLAGEESNEQYWIDPAGQVYWVTAAHGDFTVTRLTTGAPFDIANGQDGGVAVGAVELGTFTNRIPPRY